jgi:hypothetical protein
VKVMAVGTLARSALLRAGGRARVLAPRSASTWLAAAGEILWLGAPGAMLHPRAVLAPGAGRDRGASEIVLDVAALAPWEPAPAPHPRRPAVALDTWRHVAGTLQRERAPAGLGGLLTGDSLGVLEGARGGAGRLAAACADDDPASATVAAVALLGLGQGLTPSGDDYVGGALFARRVLACRASAAPAWRQAARTIVAAAPARTHPISAALLGDLAAGLGWAPLHDLAAALAAGDGGAAVAAARALTRLGHSSGWDLLAGLGAGLGALPHPAASSDAPHRA